MSDLPARCPNCAWAVHRAEALQLKPLASWLLVTIAERVDRFTLRLTASQAMLATASRMSLREVNKLLSALVEQKCIEITSPGAGGRLEYRLLRPTSEDQTYAPHAQVDPETYAPGAQVEPQTYAPHAQEPTHDVRTKTPLKESPKRSAAHARTREEAIQPQAGDRRHPANGAGPPHSDPRVLFDSADGRPHVNGWELGVVIQRLTEIAQAEDGVYPILTCTPLIDLICDGYDPHDDIYPAVRRAVERGHRAKPMSYYAKAVRDQRPSGKPQARSPAPFAFAPPATHLPWHDDVELVA